VAAIASVITGSVGRVSPGGDAVMSRTQIEELAGFGAEIGTHGHTHPELDSLTVERASDEVRPCKDQLGQWMGRPVRSVAYPHGYSSRRTRRLVEAAGYHSACGVKNALSAADDPRYAMSRLMVMSTMGDETIRDWAHGRGAPVGRDDERLLTRAWRIWRRLSQHRVPRPNWADAS
jgi:peptidoglycan/xylan/chitin deacetylase (PgdA/CDA1 family)